MFTFRAMSRRFLIVFLAIFAAGQAHGQFSWQTAAERDPAEVERIVGPIGEREPSRDLNIVWVWGIDKLHGTGFHEYAWVLDRYVNDLLPQVPRVTVTPCMYFPPKELWEKADLVVFYLWPRERWDLDIIDAYQKRGGGLIFLHASLITGSNVETGAELPKRIGMATGRGGKWGAMTSVSLSAAASDSPILKGFPAKFDFPEELYWNLAGNPASITTLLTSSAGPENSSSGPPKPEDLDGKAWPVAWTKEVGQGKVFATTLGHNFFTYDDPYFRIILFRAMAWTMNESFDPFKPLVTLHIER